GRYDPGHGRPRERQAHGGDVAGALPARGAGGSAAGALVSPRAGAGGDRAGMSAILSLLGSRALPYILAGVAALAAGGWIWWQASTIEALRGDLASMEARAERAEDANRLLAAEMDRQRAEAARNEAAL